MTEIEIPDREIIDINKLKVDGNNPNRMTEAQHEALRKNIEMFGFIIPIITNSEYVIADGEQRYTVAKKEGWRKVPVIKLNIKDVDRRILRQVLNKLKGDHSLSMDIEEFERIAKSHELKKFAEYMGRDEQYFQDIIKMKKIELEQYLVLREMDEEALAKMKHGKQIKLALTKDQVDKLKAKFGEEAEVARIVDYFLVIE